MRDALDRWTQETGDLGLIKPESKLVREDSGRRTANNP